MNEAEPEDSAPENPAQMEKAGARIQTATRLEWIVNSLPVLISYIDSEERYQFNNSAYELWFGISANSLRGRPIREVVGEQAYEAISPHIKAVLGGERTSYETKVPYQTAGTREVRVEYIPDIDKSGRVRGFCAFIIDETARRVAEVTLRASEERFRRLVETTSAISWEADPVTWNFTYVAPRAVEILGFPVEKWLEASFWVDHMHADDREFAIQFCRESCKKSEDYEFDYRMIAADGRVVWIHDIVHVVREGDEPVKLRGFMLDISERKRSEETRARLAALVESSQDAIYGGAMDGTITNWNPAAERLYGYSANEMIGRSAFILYPPDRMEEGRSLVDRLKLGEQIKPFRTVRVTKAGREIPISLSVSPIHDATGRVIGASAIARDISDRLRLEAEVLGAAETEKRRIAQDLHDSLGQHLTGTSYLCSNLKMVLESKGQPEARDAGEIARLLGDAVQQARSLARGLLPIESRAEGLADALWDLCDRVRSLYQVECAFEYPKRISVFNRTAATHLYRIAQEACTNAIKHGHATRVEISFTDDGDHVVLAVLDNGSGFPKDRPVGQGMGLRTMLYRADLIGGSLSISRRPTAGTAVTCSVRTEVLAQADGD